MKRYFNIITAICCTLLLTTACVNDLNTEPLTEDILTTEKAWADPNTYEQFVAKVYAGFALSGNENPAGLPDIVGADQGEATFIRSYWNLQELCTDEVKVAWDNETLRGLQFCQWNSNNNFVLLNYDRIFLNIAFANEYLRETTDDKLVSRGVSDVQMAQIITSRNEVRALRAINYYFLMDLYANIPFIPETAGVGAYMPEQKDRAFFFPWIESELKAVEANLPANVHTNYGKVTQATAWMVLSKLYLNATVYIGADKNTEALTYLNKILAAGYTIDPKYASMFGADNYKSNEIIFPIVYDGTYATTWGGTKFLCCSSYKSDMNTTVNFGVTDSWSGNRSTQAFSSLFAADDARALFWKTDRTQDVTAWEDFNKGWSVVKYTNMNNYDVTTPTPAASGAWIDTDFPMYRLADAYLMYAEAVVRGGTGGTRAQAVTYVNELRTRAKTAIITDSDLTLDFLLNERSRELYWEGHRRTDLIRFGRFTSNYTWPWKNGVYTGTANIDEKFKLYPLPATELSANPNLKQNKGY